MMVSFMQNLLGFLKNGMAAVDLEVTRTACTSEATLHDASKILTMLLKTTMVDFQSWSFKIFTLVARDVKSDRKK